MNARKFLFGDDFRGPVREAAPERASTDRAAHERVERDAFERGVQEGRRQAEAESTTARRLAQAMETLASGATATFGELDGRVSAVEETALVFFHTLASRLAGRAIDAQPLAAVAEAAREAFRHLRGVPHLAVRTPAGQVEEVDRLLRGMAVENGFEGRIIVLGDESLAPGDARLEWADGGIVRSRRDLEAAAAALLAETLAPGAVRPAEPNSQIEET